MPAPLSDKQKAYCDQLVIDMIILVQDLKENGIITDETTNNYDTYYNSLSLRRISDKKIAGYVPMELWLGGLIKQVLLKQFGIDSLITDHRTLLTSRAQIKDIGEWKGQAYFIVDMHLALLGTSLPNSHQSYKTPPSIVARAKWPRFSVLELTGDDTVKLKKGEKAILDSVMVGTDERKLISEALQRLYNMVSLNKDSLHSTAGEVKGGGAEPRTPSGSSGTTADRVEGGGAGPATPKINSDGVTYSDSIVTLTDVIKFNAIAGGAAAGSAHSTTAADIEGGGAAAAREQDIPLLVSLSDSFNVLEEDSIDALMNEIVDSEAHSMRSLNKAYDEQDEYFLSPIEADDAKGADLGAGSGAEAKADDAEAVDKRKTHAGAEAKADQISTFAKLQAKLRLQTVNELNKRQPQTLPQRLTEKIKAGVARYEAMRESDAFKQLNDQGKNLYVLKYAEAFLNDQQIKNISSEDKGLQQIALAKLNWWIDKYKTRQEHVDLKFREQLRSEIRNERLKSGADVAFMQRMKAVASPLERDDSPYTGIYQYGSFLGSPQLKKLSNELQIKIHKIILSPILDASILDVSTSKRRFRPPALGSASGHQTPESRKPATEIQTPVVSPNPAAGNQTPPPKPTNPMVRAPGQWTGLHTLKF